MAGRARTCLCSVTPISGALSVQGAGGLVVSNSSGPTSRSRDHLYSTGATGAEHRPFMGLPTAEISRLQSVCLPLKELPPSRDWDGRKRRPFTRHVLGHMYLAVLACSHTTPHLLFRSNRLGGSAATGAAGHGVAWHGVVNTRGTRSVQRGYDCCYYCCGWLPASLVLPPAFPSSCRSARGIGRAVPLTVLSTRACTNPWHPVLTRTLVCRACAQTPELAMCLRLFHSRRGRQESFTIQAQPYLVSMQWTPPPL